MRAPEEEEDIREQKINEREGSEGGGRKRGKGVSGEDRKVREEKDAIEHVRELLLSGKHASEDDLKNIDKDVKKVVNASADFAKESPEPAVAELWTDIYVDA